MLAEFFDRIVTLGRDSERVQFHTHESLPDRVYVQNGSECVSVEIPPRARRPSVRSFADVVAMAQDGEIAPDPEIYVGSSGLSMLLDRSDRNESSTTELTRSKRLDAAAVLELPRQFEPRDAIKLLRFELHGANTDSVIQALSRVDFQRTSGGSSSVDHGKESLGRSVEASVQQADTIPDRFTIDVPVWSSPGFSHHMASIQCGVYLDLVTQKVELRVLSDEIERVINLALDKVVAELRTALPDVPVFRGHP